MYTPSKHINGVIVSVLPSSTVDHGFEPSSTVDHGFEPSSTVDHGLEPSSTVDHGYRFNLLQMKVPGYIGSGPSESNF